MKNIELQGKTETSWISGTGHSLPLSGGFRGRCGGRFGGRALPARRKPCSPGIVPASVNTPLIVGGDLGYFRLFSRFPAKICVSGITAAGENGLPPNRVFAEIFCLSDKMKKMLSRWSGVLTKMGGFIITGRTISGATGKDWQRN